MKNNSEQQDVKGLDLENLNFEDSIKSLEEVIESLEKGEISLEDSLDLFQKGIKLTQHCQVQLKDAEQRIKQLLPNDSGELVEEEFNSEIRPYEL